MSELNFLKEIPKDFIKEHNLYKYLLSNLIDIKGVINYVKGFSDMEAKTIDTFGKNTPIIVRQFETEVQSQNHASEDFSNLLGLLLNTLLNFENSAKCLEDFSQNNYVSKLSNETIEEIEKILKNYQDTIPNAIKDHYNNKSKLKAAISKYDKVYKELETNINSKRKLDNDDKNSYNLALRNKIDDKLLNHLNEVEESRSSSNIAFSDYKKSEEVIYGINSNVLTSTIRSMNQYIGRISNIYNDIFAAKSENISKIVKDLQRVIYINEGFQLVMHGLEFKYAEIKNIKYGKTFLNRTYRELFN